MISQLQQSSAAALLLTRANQIAVIVEELKALEAEARETDKALKAILEKLGV